MEKWIKESGGKEVYHVFRNCYKIQEKEVVEADDNLIEWYGIRMCGDCKKRLAREGRKTTNPIGK